MAYPLMHHMHARRLVYLVHFHANFSVSALPCTYLNLSFPLSITFKRAAETLPGGRLSWAYSPQLPLESKSKGERDETRQNVFARVYMY